MNISGKTPGKTDTAEPLNPLKGLLELKRPNQLAKLQLSLREERPPSSADPIGRREDPQPARLRSIRLDKAKMNVEVTPRDQKTHHRAVHRSLPRFPCCIAQYDTVQP